MNNIGQRVQIDQIIIHPNYTGDVTQGFDLALIHLSSPLCFNENVQFISYATPNNTMPQDIAPNKKVFISGWGYTSPGSGASNVLMGADLTIINNFDANDLLDDPSNGCPPPVPGAVNSGMLPLFEKNVSGGFGDSGGPAVIMVNGGPMLVGVISWTGCPKGIFPTVCASVRALHGFIDKNLADVSPLCSCPDFDIHIWHSTTIEVDTDMPGNVFVHSGAQLEVKNATVTMRTDKKIVVERNARLYVHERGVLTKGCGANFWQGVAVQGNSLLAQPDHDAPLNNPAQAGIVWADDAKILWANLGISAGEGLAPNFGGGLVWVHQVRFGNNKKSVSFARYRAALNRSRFSNTDFNFDLFIPNSEGAEIADTDGIEFSDCLFFGMAQEGIRSYDAAVTVTYGSRFYDNETGISAFATYPMSRKIVIGAGNSISNEFSDNRYHINASLATGFYGSYSQGKFDINVVNNAFINGDYGVILDGPSNYAIGGNYFYNTRRSGWITNTAYNTFSHESVIACNTFDQGKMTGIAIIGTNEILTVEGNTFYMRSNAWSDFVLSPSIFPAIDGSIFPIQGSATRPSANCFTGLSNRDLLTGGPTVPFEYWYDPGGAQVGCNAEPFTPGNYTKEDVQLTEGQVDCTPFGGGGIARPESGITPEALSTSRAALQALLPQINTDPAAKSAYYEIRKQKDGILGQLVDNAAKNGQYAEAEALLNSESSKAAQWAILGLRVERGDYTAASEWLEQMAIENEEDVAFRAIQRINLLRLQAGGYTDLTDTQESVLTAVAASTSPVRGFARALLGLLKDRRFAPDSLLFVEERSQPVEKQKTTLLAELKVVPVPASEVVTISWPPLALESDARLLVYDMQGIVLINTRVQPSEHQRNIRVAQWPNGLYIVALADKGKLLYQSKFHIQH